MKENLSLYAYRNELTTNSIALQKNPNSLYAEFIAEAWAEYCNNPSPRPIALEIGKIIENEYIKKIGG